MKRKLSLLLALVMILSLVPMGAFAESDNRVNKVPKVADNKDFTRSDAPKLRLTEDFVGDIEAGDTFRLTLEGAGAEWNYSKNDTVTGAVYAEGTGGTPADLNVKVITDTIIELEVGSGFVKGDEETRIDIPMFVTLDGKGEAKVIVDPRGTTLSAGTYTYAVASAGETVVTVSKSKTVNRGASKAGAQFVIDETSAGALAAGEEQKFEIELPEGFEWDTANTSVKPDSEFGVGTSLTPTLKAGDPEVLVVEFEPDETDGAYDNSVARSIVIEPVFDVTRDADFGDVEIDIKNRKGDISSENNLLIAEYKDFGVVMEIEEVKEFYAGRVDEDYVTAEITLSENAENSIIRDRVIEFELPEWVQIYEKDEVTITDDDDTTVTLAHNYKGDLGEDTSVFEMKVTGGTGSAQDIKFEIPLTIEANKTGDIELTVSGAGIEEQSIVIGEAVAPIEVEIEMTDVRVGIQNQPAADILIKEVAPGALQEDSYLTFEFANDYDMTFEDAEFEVVSGDIKLDLDKSGVSESPGSDDDKTIDIYIDRDSDEEEAVIKVTGITMTLDRSVPEGPFDLKVKGDAIVENADYNDGDFAGQLARVEFANVITKASTEYHATSKFTIGSTEYTVLRNGVEVDHTMDVAPFISADGRTLLPVRYMAEAVGLNDDQISWDETSRTVTLFGDKVVQIKIDSRTLTVNGTPVAMDTAATIKDGRTFLPARFIAQALGFDVEWDAVNQVVTIEK